MSNRINALTVVLEEDIPEEYADHLMAAISLLKGVIGVEAHVNDHTDIVARMQIRHEMKDKLWEVLYPKIK